MKPMVHRSTPAEPDFLNLELGAICAVGKALESLDPETRLRVLRWANERYQVAANPTRVVASAVIAVAPVAAVPVLRLAVPQPDAPVLRFAAVAAQEGPFLHLAPAPEVDSEPEYESHLGLAIDLDSEPAVESEPGPDLTVDSLRDLFELPAGPPPVLVEEKGALPGETEDLSDLCVAESFEEVYEQAMDVYELPAEPAPLELHLVTREDQPFEQLIDDFVDNLQRMTDECLDAEGGIIHPPRT
jgi:hypothetical protein